MAACVCTIITTTTDGKLTGTHGKLPFSSGEQRTDGVLHDDDDGEHGPHGGDAPVVEDGAHVVEHGHQRERQPHLERVRHPPRVVPLLEKSILVPAR